MEESLRGDYSLIKAWKADRLGNLIFKETTGKFSLVCLNNHRIGSGNFNIPMCKASNCTIVEVEEIVEVGEIAPHNVHVTKL